MIKAFNRFFNAQKEEVDMSKTKEQEVSAKELESMQVDSEMSSALTAAMELNASQVAMIAELTSKYEAAQAALSEIEQSKENLIAEQLAAKLQSRKEKVESLIGTVKAPALLSATEALDDTSFAAVLQAVTASVDQESKSELFREVGASGSVDGEQVQESGVASLIKSKYNK